MLQLDFRDRRPLYEQIKENMKKLIMSGVLKEDQKIPSVREMAQSLTINPNTIQKAYKDLDAEGYIYSIRGKGSFVAPQKDAVNQVKVHELMDTLEKAVSELMYLGVKKEQVISFVDNMFKERKVEELND